MERQSVLAGRYDNGCRDSRQDAADTNSRSFANRRDSHDRSRRPSAGARASFGHSRRGPVQRGRPRALFIRRVELPPGSDRRRDPARQGGRDPNGRGLPAPRRVSGYNLPELLPENGFNVARALAGSECTLALTLEVVARLVPNPPARSLLVLGY